MRGLADASGAGGARGLPVCTLYTIIVYTQTNYSQSARLLALHAAPRPAAAKQLAVRRTCSLHRMVVHFFVLIKNKSCIKDGDGERRPSVSRGLTTQQGLRLQYWLLLQNHHPPPGRTGDPLPRATGTSCLTQRTEWHQKRRDGAVTRAQSTVLMY